MSQQTRNKNTPVEVVSLTQLLAQFRAKLETEAEVPVTGLEVNAALLLSDLCRFLGLGTPQRDRVLGPKATQFTNEVESAHIKLPTKH